MLTEAAPAKVNLYLHVTGRRADGYHTLDSLAVFPGAGDVLRAGPAAALTLTVDGPMARGLSPGPENLVLRAAVALAAAAAMVPRAALVLEKRLPVASGIGGGSADAAAALRVLDRAWGLGFGVAGLAGVAATLGADVPVCVASVPAVMQGVGEVMLPAPMLPAFDMVLVNPGVAVATPAVFAARSGGFSDPAMLPAAWGDVAALVSTLSGLRNDLEPPALSLCPAVADVLAWLRSQPGCLLARMSGSGATCYGLFGPGDAARVGAAPAGWWRWAGPCAMGGATHSYEGGGFTDGGRAA